jgi:hypothetical protein
MRLMFVFAILCATLMAEEKGETPLQVPKNWQKIDTGAFTFYAPPDFKNVPVNGIDSFVGEYENADWRVHFDFGSWSNKLNDKDYTTKEIVIDNRRGHLAFKDKFSGVYLPDVYPPQNGGSSHLNVCIDFKKEDGDKKLAEIILRSLEFRKLEKK